MSISAFELFSIGIGPSSSHTVGPMRAAYKFAAFLEKTNLIEPVSSIKVDLYGSLALTGKGHGTDKAILLGLEGERPELVNPDTIEERLATIRRDHEVSLFKKKMIPFHEETDLLFHRDKQLPFHPNGMRFRAYSMSGGELALQVYYSVGGGFIVDHETASKDKTLGDETHSVPYPFKTAKELLHHCEVEKKTIAEITLLNEMSWRTKEEVKRGLLHIWDVMKQCVQRGIHGEGILPGGLNVKRRAGHLYKTLLHSQNQEKKNPFETMEWVSLWALAVNEENAVGSQVVTAPTNGAAGIIPAVMHFYWNMTENPTEDGILAFLLTAAAIGILYKEGASISAAEMGCMGEVGVACSMAAAGLTAALGGSVLQCENAAEIGMEHNLGLTCDPVKGLVQIPCIERNTMGAIKAINAAVLALQGDGTHRVSLDDVIATMRQTGHDMQSIYKETSLGGLAVNVPEC